MFSSIKNIILIGLGINKIALEKIDSIFSHKLHEEPQTGELVGEFLESPKKKKENHSHPSGGKAKSKKQKSS